ncbi:MAG: alpha-amylase family glycosyl hydrolase [Oscillospiraceae bacterium]|nr:alpha-amylase family glycosyl hydrolase [Oscillospiraceae bacterium]
MTKETKIKYNILRIDPYTEPYAFDIDLRMRRYEETKRALLKGQMKLSSFADGHLFFGFHPANGGWFYREWAPNADEMFLFGDFNGWDRTSYPMRKTNGYWEIFIPGKIPHESKTRIMIQAKGQYFERIPLYCKRVVQIPQYNTFDGVIWQPDEPFLWTDEGFCPKKPLMIYECHIGMSGEKEGISTFAEFTETVLPRIKRLGYTAVQVMAVMEHPYYGSFGYQVSNFFAVSSWFGTPEDFKALVNAAHGMGLAVIMDIVHSHVVRNAVEGPAVFDGTDHQFCMGGAGGDHPAWGTRLFDYGKPEVLRFLLSGVNFWMTEYHLDGFRFDGVTSMLYHHHGLGVSFTDYKQYFSLATDTRAVTYLQLAAALCKELKPECILVAEDMSGMPGMCLPIEDGGVGFDYRLGMGLADHYIKMLKEQKDEQWHLGTLWYELTNRRPGEKVIAYCESHDQALVGDKTIMFWLADREMYLHMDKNSENFVIDRALSLHKMIRLITCVCAGEAYLNFMGNEFGHPEWIDFPRQGNNWSFRYARRQWSLADNPFLRYGYLLEFDRVMTELICGSDIYDSPARLLKIRETEKILAFERGEFTFIFNFHHENSFLYPLKNPQRFKIALHSAWRSFGGFVDERSNEGLLRREGIVADRRTAVVLRRKDEETEKRKT